MPEFKVSPRVVMQCLASTERRLARDEAMAVSYRTEMNDHLVIQDLPEEAKSSGSEARLSLSSDKAQELTLAKLGQFRTDTLRYRNKPVEPRRVTMRAIYSTFASQCDPLGCIAPFTPLAKVTVRELWAQERGWDDPLPPPLEAKWRSWEEELPSLQEVQLGRSCFGPSVSPLQSYFHTPRPPEVDKVTSLATGHQRVPQVK